MELSMTGAALVFFSVLGFWRLDRIVSAPMFLFAAGCAAMLGYTWFDHYSTQSALGVSMMFFGYTVFCLSMVYRGLFLRGRNDGS